MLTLNAKQVCKCFAGSGPALYKPHLRELGSPAPPGVKMTLLTSESRGYTSETDSIQVPFEASILKYNKCQDSLIFFLFMSSWRRRWSVSILKQSVCIVHYCTAFYIRL